MQINPKMNMKNIISSICINPEPLSFLRFSELSNNSIFYPSKLKTSYGKRRHQNFNFNHILNYETKEKLGFEKVGDSSLMSKLSGDNVNLGNLLDNYLSKRKIIIHPKIKHKDNISVRQKDANFLDANRILLEKIMVE